MHSSWVTEFYAFLDRVSLVHQISETSLKSSDSESAQSSSTKQPFKAVTPTQHKTGRKLNPTQLQDVGKQFVISMFFFTAHRTLFFKIYL